MLLLNYVWTPKVSVRENPRGLLELDFLQIGCSS